MLCLLSGTEGGVRRRHNGHDTIRNNLCYNVTYWQDIPCDPSPNRHLKSLKCTGNVPYECAEVPKKVGSSFVPLGRTGCLDNSHLIFPGKSNVRSNNAFFISINIR